MPPALRQILGVTFRWAAAWSLLGLIAGILMMFGKVELIAESGVKPFHLSAYAFWIPLTFGAASVFGLALGFIFASLMTLTHQGLAATDIHPSSVALHSIRLLCGTIAGLLIGWPVTRNKDAAVVFACLGLASALVSCFTNRRTKSEQPA
jgi:hypothetical protein